MEINVVASGGLSPLAQRQGSSAVQAQERAATSPSTGSDSLVRDLGAVLDELGLSPQGESSGGGTVSIRDSLEAFINTMMGSLQQQFKMIVSYGEGNRQTNSAPKRITATYPVPKLKHVGFIDPEFHYFFLIGRQGHKMQCNGRLITRFI